jgi:hypothetical protein
MVARAGGKMDRRASGRERGGSLGARDVALLPPGPASVAGRRRDRERVHGASIVMRGVAGGSPRRGRTGAASAARCCPRPRFA